MIKTNRLRIWEEQVSIPTYGVGPMDKNPMFFEKRVYQGSSGKVYPLPVIDKIQDDKEDKSYKIIFLENDFIQVQVMPEIGGRIYRALDKTNNYDFVYYNQVMKPALVGLTGPWVSGGIEFNWPQHHRPSTYSPVQYRIDDTQEDKKTIWLSERDRMYGTQVTTGISIYADSSVIEIHSELYNPTDEAQTFLWWANPAVSVHDDTQSIFPPDVHAVMDHGKRDVSRFPIATGTYYKMDYSHGVDISRYKNIPVPTSYMAYHSEYDFVGGYDWRAQAGILHVADHHIAPGKKQWTWGCGEFGQAWDRNLTDEDGPYIELMTGVYTDNQPDFTWLAPQSGKNFTQYFMPYREIGQIKCANRDFAISLDKLDSGEYQLGIYASSISADTHIIATSPDGIILDEIQQLSPAETKQFQFNSSRPEHEIKIQITCPDRRALQHKLDEPKQHETPAKATAIGSPESLPNTEALYLAGTHLEQYRHATFSPEQYYLEGLKRDPGDVRINNAYGNMLYRRGQFADAHKHFIQAQKTITRHNSRPYDAEVFFNLGKTYQAMGQDNDAYENYYKACWSDAWKSQGYTKLAQICLKRGELDQAIEFATEALYCGQKNFTARAALTTAQRLISAACKDTNSEDTDSRTVDLAVQTAQQTLSFDPLNLAALYEISLKEAEYKQVLKQALRNDPHNYITLATIYMDIGQFREAVAILNEYISDNKSPYAMTFYYRAYCQLQIDPQSADWAQAAAADSSYCFPNSVNDYIILSEARRQNPHDAKASYYLGCLLYDKKMHHEAAKLWQEAAAKLEAASRLNPTAQLNPPTQLEATTQLNSTTQLNPNAQLEATVQDDKFPTVYRNLALYQANKLGDKQQARINLERAFELDKSDARVFYELCDLYRKIGMDPHEIVTIMEQNLKLVKCRDDLTISYVEMLNITQQHERAIEILTTRKFHPWEGGEGKIPTQHIEARIGLARKLLGKSASAAVNSTTVDRAVIAQTPAMQTPAAQALHHLEQATIYFENFGEGKLTGAQENNIYYYMGQAWQQLGKPAKANACWQLACKGLSEPTSAMYYNDQPPHMIFYQGLALKSLDREDEAKSRFNKLINYGEDNMHKQQKMDYFAVSMPDFMVFDTDLNDSNKTHCHYMIGLGKLGLGKLAEARASFAAALEITPNHSGVISHMHLID